MLRLLSIVAPVVLLVSPALADAPPAAGARPHKSVYGKLEKVAPQQYAVTMRSDDGKRLLWHFGAPVIAELSRFAPGDRMIVIYRATASNEKRVTAVAFPGKAETALYLNLTGSRVVLRSSALQGEVCGAGEGPSDETTIPNGGKAEAAGACWCCAAAGESCTPGNKTGLGEALLVSCFN